MMRVSLTILSSFLLTACAPFESPVKLPAPLFAEYQYPAQTMLCHRTLQSRKGYIRWKTALTKDSLEETKQFYNQKVGIYKHKAKPNSHVWSLKSPTSHVHRSLAVMTLAEASRLNLLCNKTIPSEANTALVVTYFVPKPQLKSKRQTASLHQRIQ